MNLVDKIILAAERIRPFCLKTPLYFSPYLSKLSQSEVYLKLESEQYTGSFKLRGACNKILSLSDKEKNKGIITASTGNHALGVAYACKKNATDGTIFLPKHASKSKIDMLDYYPVDLKFYGDSSLETELFARKQAVESGAVWISPYNDETIIAGQGTIGLEIVHQLPEVQNIFVTVGGGGLISGIATIIKHHSPSVNVIACQPENSPEMFLSIQKGSILQENLSQETLSDGSAGGIEPNAITFPIIQKFVEQFILVSEDSIADAIRIMVDKHHKIIEGAAGVAIASLLKNKEQFAGKKNVIVICGANIKLSVLLSLF